jgi:adenylate kinase family enzyme
MHADGWNSTSDDEFTRIVGEFAAQPRWVVDGNYTSHGIPTVLWPRADTFVWTDLPRPVVMTRVIRRTLKRMITRERLWNGLREPLSNLYKLDPWENIIVWTWTRFEGTRDKFEEAMRDGSWAHATVHRLRTRKEVANFVATLDSAETDPLTHH